MTIQDSNHELWIKSFYHQTLLYTIQYNKYYCNVIQIVMWVINTGESKKWTRESQWSQSKSRARSNLLILVLNLFVLPVIQYNWRPYLGCSKSIKCIKKSTIRTFLRIIQAKICSRIQVLWLFYLICLSLMCVFNGFFDLKKPSVEECTQILHAEIQNRLVLKLMHA